LIAPAGIPSPTWTSTDRRVGLWSALSIVTLSVVYVGTGAVWMLSDPAAARARGLEPGEPYLAILETLILLCTPGVVALFAAIHAWAPPQSKTCSRAAFGFAVLLAGITGTVHFVQLTAVRRMADPAMASVFARYDPAGRLTPVLAVDLAAWDFFFGWALLFAAPAFRGGGLHAAVRRGLTLAGGLCLVGVFGPASGHLRLQLAAIAGYAFVFPFLCVLLAILFARSRAIGRPDFPGF
jgi:hypothetical protein